ncbi:MAG: NAD-dependent epimerase/dehydratase family protein [Turicibacter sp.]|nr:NAD-dependent epimerase/dehydratase family protein [Turicibacter sp.]
MKRILITGKNSYIGEAVKSWVKKYHQDFMIHDLCVKDNQWNSTDFTVYDAVFHVAGIAHSDVGTVDDETKALYYKVNCDLAIAVAEKARAEGVKQFIFMSSAIVYGDSAPLGIGKRITSDSVPAPANFYGDSKWQAELGLAALRTDDFKVAVVRPPMVYGWGSKGNYPRLARLARKMPFFPNVPNERSIIHIDNLCEFIRLLMVKGDDGVFHPQNMEHTSTSGLVRAIAVAHGKNLKLVRRLGPLVYWFSGRVGVVDKVFGNFSYDMALSEYRVHYRVREFTESIRLTENKD